MRKRIQYQKIALGYIEDYNAPFYLTHPDQVETPAVPQVYYVGLALKHGASSGQEVWVTDDTKIFDYVPGGAQAYKPKLKQVKLGQIEDPDTLYFYLHPEIIAPVIPVNLLEKITHHTGQALSYGADPDSIVWVSEDTKLKEEDHD